MKSSFVKESWSLLLVQIKILNQKVWEGLWLAKAIRNSINWYFISVSITNYAIDFAGPMRSLNILNSIDNNQNIVWDKGVHLPINEMRCYGIASNERVQVATAPAVKWYKIVNSCFLYTRNHLKKMWNSFFMQLNCLHTNQ